MAVLIGSPQGLKLAWNTDLDNAGDRLLALQESRGAPSTWTVDGGFIESTQVGLETIKVAVDLNKFSDGSVNTNTLTSVSAPFTSDMVNEEIEIVGFGVRLVSSFIGADEIIFSGTPIASATGIVFRVPLGRPAGTRILTGSGSYPIAARQIPQTPVPTVVQWLVGRKP